ncbi:uncharacterized protein B0I36DRAFT_343646 [Microdochium trichocladiopsis]|uniref:Uncharacterized protein n=1 Tax=Microdochium trichocladiopsis TaxID=1682393 RepID=A0A9P9BV06_9PEZI|nr:uncharacterized protein B0I36DRAFT_343646 [Microdochium trichocladiopsis]KAH7039808.1 hypothetical protein B0I36DRAFT_343646 [Microdochium trichocladiopsis]
MRSSQLIALSGLVLSGANAQQYEANIAFALDSDSCGDGFYVGCSVNAGDCCTLASGFGEAKSVWFILGDQSPNVTGKVYTGGDCLEENFIGEQASGELNNFCYAKPAAVPGSAHYFPNGVTRVAQPGVVGGGSVVRKSAKECRSPDHLVFPGGARANIEGLAERDYKEM